MNTVDFISTLVMHFPVRHESEMREREWLGSMIGAVKHYEGDILQRAAQTIIDTRTDRRFPLPAEIRKVCFEIASDERRSKLAFEGGEKFKASDPWSPQRIRLADELMRTPMGREAAEGGWIVCLHDFVRKNGRLPEFESQKRELIRAAQDFDESYRRVVIGGFPGAKALRELGDKMLARRDALAKRVLGE